MKKLQKIAAAVAFCIASTAPAFAQGTTFTNGDFSNGLTGWDSIGDVSVVTYQGGLNQRAVLTTAYLDGEPVSGDQANNLSGVSAAPLQDLTTVLPDGTQLFEPGLAPFLAANPLDFDLNEGFAYEGSAIKQTFNVLAGEQLSVDFWFGLLTEETELLSFNDFAFITVNGIVELVASISDPSRTGSFTHNFTNSGPVTVGFGVVDINDVAGVSEFRIDNISVSAVPEPETYAMLLAGLGLVGAFTRRRKAQASQA
jgi:hypothetical protein